MSLYGSVVHITGKTHRHDYLSLLLQYNTPRPRVLG